MHSKLLSTYLLRNNLVAITIWYQFGSVCIVCGTIRHAQIYPTHLNFVLNVTIHAIRHASTNTGCHTYYQDSAI